MAVAAQIGAYAPLGRQGPLGVGLLPSMDGGPTFGEWVRRYRKIGRLTQQQLAEKVGTDKAGMNLIEGDKREPGHDLAQRIIKALDAPAGPFLRALGYPLPENAIQSWEAQVLADPRFDDDDKAALLRAGRAMILAGSKSDEVAAS